MSHSVEVSQDLFVVEAESRGTSIFMISVSLEQHPFGVISECMGVLQFVNSLLSNGSPGIIHKENHLPPLLSGSQVKAVNKS